MSEEANKPQETTKETPTSEVVSDAVRCSTLAVTQELVDRIKKRAEDSKIGIETPVKKLDLSLYADKDLMALSMCLVSGYHYEWDLISIFNAAFEEILAQSNFLSSADEPRGR